MTDYPLAPYTAATYSGPLGLVGQPDTEAREGRSEPCECGASHSAHGRMWPCPWSQLRLAPSGCWEWTRARNGSGYGLCQGHRAHRVAFERAFGPIPPGMFICHRCDNPPCVRPDHLFMGSLADNNADMKAKLRLEHGATHHGVRAPYSVVEEARRMHKAGLSYRVIGIRLGISKWTVRAWICGARAYGS